jgi:transcriptional regulator with XRE-family HTH domain
MPRANLPTAHDRYIGERIREARIAGKISQEDLADMIGISYQQVQKYETGKNRVNGARFDRLCTALNRPLSYFFPNSADIRDTSGLSAFLTNRKVQELAKAVAPLRPTDQDFVLTQAVATAKHLGKG